MSRHYSELIEAAIENVTGALTSVKKGLLKFRTDGAKSDRPFIDDGTAFDQLMMEKHLPEARRDTKVQLDDAGTGNEVSGSLPYNKGGTGLSTLAGQAGNFVQVNGTEDGYDLTSVVVVGNDIQVDSTVMQDDSVTRNLLSIDSSVYKAFEIDLIAHNTSGAGFRAGALRMAGKWDSTSSTWRLSPQTRETWAGSEGSEHPINELSVTNAATLVLDYVETYGAGTFVGGTLSYRLRRFA